MFFRNIFASSSLLYRFSDIKVSSQKTHFDITSESPDELEHSSELTVFRQLILGAPLNAWS